ncbi:helix-turn-helix domain-containing protein [Kibdelosporangium philippinense]|uniref:Helix-turn-helix domain-containing protein n=1 Tax=Kibdelosporangium philippinense TaxID=211113 RepID=A0ABS8ZDZ7_9PSEU|nr:helix-turn-helix domain-containing protein [Kibdelosporangium philippinense]MCE7005469.1 helix-turn-helix domain-containing protein [Kibdelosporangium philippinense]
MNRTDTGPANGATRLLLDVPAAARQLSISRTTMYALLKSGEIESVKIGTLRRVPLAALAAYTARKASEQRAAA